MSSDADQSPEVTSEPAAPEGAASEGAGDVAPGSAVAGDEAAAAGGAGSGGEAVAAPPAVVATPTVRRGVRRDPADALRAACFAWLTREHVREEATSTEPAEAGAGRAAEPASVVEAVAVEGAAAVDGAAAAAPVVKGRGARGSRAPARAAVAPAVEAVAAPVAAEVREAAAPVVEVAAPVVEVAAPVVEVVSPVAEVGAPVAADEAREAATPAPDAAAAAQDADAAPDETSAVADPAVVEAIDGVLASLAPGATPPVAAPAADPPAIAAVPKATHDVARAHLKGVIEALLFASDRPMPLKDIVKAAKAERALVKELLGELVAEYRPRGFRLDEVAGGYAFRTSPAFSPFVRELGEKKPVRMSRAQLETLAIVAYRQPVTRPEIDDVRGVDSGAALKSLLERELVRILGKKEEPGRPMLYGTTAAFLEFFGLRALADLPTLREFTELTDESRRTFERELGEEPPDFAPPADPADAGLMGGEGELRAPGHGGDAAEGGALASAPAAAPDAAESWEAPPDPPRPEGDEGEPSEDEGEEGASAEGDAPDADAAEPGGEVDGEPPAGDEVVEDEADGGDEDDDDGGDEDDDDEDDEDDDEDDDDEDDEDDEDDDDDEDDEDDDDDDE